MLSKQYYILIVFLFYLSAQGQDIHFSQFTASPFNLNPALTGQFNGNYRFIGNQRTQWRSITIPYQTFGVSADAHQFLKANKLGAGISMYKDKAGDSEFGTLQAHAAFSYTTLLRQLSDISHYLTFGLQMGMVQQNISYDKLKFENQYNGLRYDPSIASIETFENKGRTHPDFNMGILWQYLPLFPKKIKVASAGISLFNLTKPTQSFFNDNDIKLDRRFNFHGTAQIELIKDIDMLPAVLWMKQGKFTEFDIGSAVKYLLDERPFHYRAVYLGFWYRNKDAGFITAGMDCNKLYMGISYDINISNLKPASHAKGGFEFSVIYIIERKIPVRQNYRSCPDFI